MQPLGLLDQAFQHVRVLCELYVSTSKMRSQGVTCLCAAGHGSAKMSLYYIAATLVLLALLLSKTSSNLKSLVKDDHWMQRVSLVLDRLSRGGLEQMNSVVEIMHDASMSNFVWPQNNGPAAPENQTFGLPRGYAGAVGAKAALAPPSSGADDLYDSIAAGNMNTVDGANQMVHPAEARL
jgi:hypothetical protein